jgi:outer membrane protein TolC
MPAHCWQPGRLAVLILTAGLLAGCTAKYYRKSADKETYRIIQEVDRRVFGKTNAFTIDTPYSGRDLRTIPPAEIIQDRMSTNRRIINLDQALDLAVQNSREYQDEKETLYLKALSLTGARYEFTPQVIANSTAHAFGSGRFVDVPYRVGTNTFFRSEYQRSEQGSVNNRIEVSTLLRTGGRLTVALANDLIHYFIRSPDSRRNTAASVLSVELTQPLLRGFGINNPFVERLTQTERDVVYAVRRFNRFQQSFAVQTVVDYFNLLTQKDIVRNYYRDYTNRIETTRYLETRAVDRERRSDVDNARTEDLQAKRDYIDALAGYLNLLDGFKLRLGIPVSETLYLDDRDLRDLIEAGLTPVEIERQAAFRLSLEKQADVLNAIDQFEDSKRKVRLARDQLRPGASLFANASINSEDRYDYANWDPNKVRYDAGIQVDLPFDRLIERNEYRTALVSFESQLRALSRRLDEYRDRIDSGLRGLEQRRLNYLNGVESLKVAQRRVENNTMLLEAGRTTIINLRDAQDALIESENRLAQLYTAYLSARLNLLVDIGVIQIEPDRFWLLDPLKDMLLPAQRGEPPLRMPDDRVLPPENFLEPAT